MESTARTRASIARWLLLINMAASFYGVGQIWLVQVTCYPLWSYVGPREFVAYHDFWWHSIWGVVLAPSLFAVLFTFAMLRWHPDGVSTRIIWSAIAVQVITYALTGIWWGRWMAELIQMSGAGYGELFQKLLTTHWLRVALITGNGLLVFKMLVSHFGERDTADRYTPASDTLAPVRP